MQISYQVESFKDLRDEIDDLWLSHYKEIARHQDKIALSPDYDRYMELDQAGVLHIVTARDESKLVGYFFSFVMPNLHYKEHLMSMNDLLYILPSHRKGRIGTKMLQYAEETLKEMGVTKMMINVKLANDFGVLLERLGYVAIERIYERMLI